MNASNIFDIGLLNKMIDEGYVEKKKHPSAELYLYDYTQFCQFENVWNDVTKMCRGLILDADYNIIARPFPKFKNYEELNKNEIPNLPYKVFIKLDGSLGILYFNDNKPYIATRGSFSSVQSIVANEILYSKYQHLFEKLNKNKTYLFEIIYKENRIVVNYGDIKDIFLLTVVDNETGKDEIEDIGFPIVEEYGSVSFDELKKLNKNNEEGYVIKFDNNFRMKIKFEDYVRLHKIVTGISSKDIWEILKYKKNYFDLLKDVPDEFHNWFRNTITTLQKNYKDAEDDCKNIFEKIDRNLSRKEIASIFLQHKKYYGVLFLMLDNKNYDEIIWDIVKPKYEKAFSI